MPATNRISSLHQKLLNFKPAISTERAKLYTSAIKAAQGLPVIMQRSIGFATVLNKMKIKIRADELIVGNLTEKDRGAIVTLDAQ
jgi:pyruvate-formate lyase